MKTLNTLTRPTVNQNSKRVRTILTLLGIVIAIFCVVALCQEGRSADIMNVGIPPLIQTSKIVGAELFMAVKTWL